MKSADFVNKRPKIVEATAEPVVVETMAELDYPEINMESLQAKFDSMLQETASAGASSAGAVATVVGELGGQNPKQLRKKQQGYTNVVSRGGPVKAKK